MITETELLKISSSYETPMYLFDTAELLARAEAIKGILKKGDIRFCYSIKANPFLVPFLKDTVDCFEACSPGELSICMHYHIPGDMVVYSGVHKELSDIREAVSYGAGIITAESLRQFGMICDAAKDLDHPIKVIPRLSSKIQFGMSVSDTESVIKRSLSEDNIDIVGFHYFAGTQRTNLSHQSEELDMLCDFLLDMRNKYNLPFRVIEYGPGLPYPYFIGNDFTDTLSPLKELSEKLCSFADSCDLTVEMGRFLASSCGYYLTQVCDKKSSGDRNWCILDGGIHHVNYLGQTMGLKVPIIKHIPSATKAKPKEKWSLCGSLCTSNDMLVRSVEMEEPEIGDILAFCNTGAYSVTEGISLFLSRDLPSIVAYDGHEAVLLRRPLKTWDINSCS